MSKTREKALAFTLLTLIVGVLHFFFGRAILSAVLYVLEIGLFWIIGAVIALCFIAAVIATIFDVDNLKKAEKWLDKRIAEDDECDCEDCDCCECDCDDDDEIECHIEIRRKKKECSCEECECEAEDVADEEESENVDEAEEDTAEPDEEESSEPAEK